MKSLTLKLAVLSALFLLSACSKKEDQPPAGVPNVAGQWQGNGTDDKVGFYNVSATLTQSGTSASGTITMANANGDVRFDMTPSRGTASGTITIAVQFPSENCTTTFSESALPITTGGVALHYSGRDCSGAEMNGGLNFHRTMAAASSSLSIGGLSIGLQ